jgi:hypothetical protein
MDVKSQKGSKTSPTLVKVISVLYYIGAVFMLLAGIGVIILGTAYGSSLSSFLDAFGLGAFGGAFAAIFIVFGVIILAFAVLYFFVGRGLWGARNWARIVAIVLAILGILSAISGIIQVKMLLSNIVGLVINGLIGGYLLFSKSVKEAFS